MAGDGRLGGGSEGAREYGCGGRARARPRDTIGEEIIDGGKLAWDRRMMGVAMTAIRVCLSR